MGDGKKFFLAVDIGASSGRHIAGWLEDGEIKTEELYRFPNGVTELDGHLTWDIDALLDHVKRGIAAAKDTYPQIESLSIDTWGVDYVLLRGDEEVRPCYAYRDGRTETAIPLVHEKMPFSELYRRTGIQFQRFNTIYQLYADKLAGRLEGVTDFLMMPEYLLYKLCGVKAHEYTNATTGGMVSALTGEYDPAIIEALGLPKHLFRPLQQPGTVIGEYKGIQVVLCATHDTGSAVEGIPMEEDAPYISSGTWSLLGVKTVKPITDAASEKANWSNEGGVGCNRYQKNIMGMWLVNRLREELCPDKPFNEIVIEAESSRFQETVDANAPVFLAPESMKAAFDGLLPEKPQSVGDYFRCAYRSLALCYADAIRELEQNTGRHYDSLYIVGGGAKNAFLNDLTEKATGKKVIALPIEATAIGNLKVQMEADK
jgi:rhamnulokinase